MTENRPTIEQLLAEQEQDIKERKKEVLRRKKRYDTHCQEAFKQLLQHLRLEPSSVSSKAIIALLDNVLTDSIKEEIRLNDLKTASAKPALTGIGKTAR